MSVALDRAGAEPFLTAEDAARVAGMSVASIKRKCAEHGLGFKPGGVGRWRIRPATLDAFLRGERLR